MKTPTTSRPTLQVANTRELMATFNVLIAHTAITLVGVSLAALFLLCSCFAALLWTLVPHSNRCNCQRTCCKWCMLIFCVIATALATAGVALSWPRGFPRNYQSEAYTTIPGTLRDQAVRTGVHAGLLIRASIDCEDELSAKEASSVTMENGMKWSRLARDSLDTSRYNWVPVDKTVDRARSANQRVRGHALVWDSLKLSTPDPLIRAVEASNNKPETARQAMFDHFAAIIPRYADVISEWDVVNEPIKGSPPKVSGEFQGPLYTALGEEYIDEAFMLARNISDQVRPGTKLFVNEAFGSNYDLDSAFIVAFLDLLDRLQARNVPVDCVGIQGHGFFAVPSKNSLMAFAKEVMKRGLCVAFTEVDARVRIFESAPDPYEAHGDAHSVYYQVCAELGAGNCTGVTSWAITDITSWYDAFLPFQLNRVNDAHLFDVDGIRKPAWKGAYNAFETLPDATQFLDPPLPSPTNGSATISCSGGDLVYKWNEGIYFAALALAIIVWLCLLHYICWVCKREPKATKSLHSDDHDKDEIPLGSGTVNDSIVLS